MTAVLAQLRDFSRRDENSEYRTHICAEWLTKVQGNVYIDTHLPYVTWVIERYHHGEMVSSEEPLGIGLETYS